MQALLKKQALGRVAPRRNVAAAATKKTKSAGKGTTRIELGGYVELAPRVQRQRSS